MSRFHITTIRPSGFLHTSAFDEVVDSLAWSLTALGHDVTVNPNWLTNDPQATNIVFGAELLSPACELPRNTVIYNLEQASHPQMEKVRGLARGLQVWDFSLANVHQWLKLGYDARHVPVGFTPNLCRIPQLEKRDMDIDVLFLGWITPRRQAVLDELRASGLHAVSSDHCYRGSRDNLIARSKIVLNIHHDGRDCFEVVRVSYLLANGKCVVSELSRDDEEYRDLHKGFFRVPTTQIVAKCKELIRLDLQQLRNCRFDDVRPEALKAIAQRDYTETVRRALEVKPPQQKVAERYLAACSQGDMQDFAPWLSRHAKGTILEIGVRDGASTSAFLTGLEQNGGVLVSVDVADCSALFAGHPQWKFCQTSSQNEKFKCNEQVDLLLIDGDHTREGFKADLERYYPLVRDGGLVLCHDIRPEPGQTFEDHPGSDYPSVAVGEEYFAFCAKHNLEHEELPGKYGLGVIYKPGHAEQTESDESWEASEALCS